MGDKLIEKPARKVLFCISPPWAKHYGVLPIKLSQDEEVLHTVARAELSAKDLAQLCSDARMQVVVDRTITPEQFKEAYARFYEGLI